jgi:hypothetical protein
MSAAPVGLGGGQSGLTRAVAVAALLHLIEGVVVVPEEVPARDVVDVAVAIVIDPIAEQRDEVAGVTHPVGVAARVLARFGIDAGVVGPVGHVEDAVAVEVVGADVLAGSVLGERELAAVEPVLVDRLAPGPLDARVHDGDDDVGAAHADRPRLVHGHARAEGPLVGADLGLRDLVGVGGVQVPLVQGLEVPRARAVEAALGVRADGHVGEGVAAEEEEGQGDEDANWVHGRASVAHNAPRVSDHREGAPARLTGRSGRPYNPPNLVF